MTMYGFSNGLLMLMVIVAVIGAVVVYDITDPANPTWDSGAIAQLVDYSRVDGTSVGESEGLAYKKSSLIRPWVKLLHLVLQKPLI